MKQEDLGSIPALFKFFFFPINTANNVVGRKAEKPAFLYCYVSAHSSRKKTLDVLSGAIADLDKQSLGQNNHAVIDDFYRNV